METQVAVGFISNRNRAETSITSLLPLPGMVEYGP